MGASAFQWSVAGSYSQALLMGTQFGPLGSSCAPPPKTYSLPLYSVTARWCAGSGILFLLVQVLAAMSYSSTSPLGAAVLPMGNPPKTHTFPFAAMPPISCAGSGSG